MLYGGQTFVDKYFKMKVSDDKCLVLTSLPYLTLPTLLGILMGTFA